MSDTKQHNIELCPERLLQTDEERVEALVKLGATQRRAKFIVQMSHNPGQGDVINVSDKEALKSKVT